MTENEYIIVSNLTRVRDMLDIVESLCPGEDTGITDEQRKTIYQTLTDCQKKLFKQVGTLKE